MFIVRVQEVYDVIETNGSSPDANHKFRDQNG